MRGAPVLFDVDDTLLDWTVAIDLAVDGALSELGLEHIVITSVDRDDLPDGGAFQFARCIRAIRQTSPKTTIG